jgi:hypothetical protein
MIIATILQSVVLKVYENNMTDHTCFNWCKTIMQDEITRFTFYSNSMDSIQRDENLLSLTGFNYWNHFDICGFVKSVRICT